MNLNCETLQDDLLAYRDEELPLARRLVVRWHLTHCAVCREELKIMETISEKLRSEESATGHAATLNPALRDKILSSVAAEDVPTEAAGTATTKGQATSATRAPVKQVRPRLHLMEWGAAVAGVFILAALTFPVFNKAKESARKYSPTSASPLAKISPDASYDRTTVAGGGGGALSMPPPASAPSVNEPGNNVFTDGHVKRNQPLSSSSNALSTGSAADYAAPSAAPVQNEFMQRRAGYAERAPGSLSRSANNMASSKIRPGYSAPGMSGLSTDNLPSSLRRVHKEARITVEVVDLEEKSNAVEAMVKSAGGFVADNTLATGAEGLKTSSLAIKVPVKQFETILSSIAKLGEVKAKNVSGEDITEKFSDTDQANRVLGSELSVKEAQLKKALEREENDKKKKFTVSWQQRAEVRELRILAAQARARLELLRKTSDLANISVQLQEKPKTPSQGGFLQEFSETGGAAMDTFLLAVRLPMYLLLWALAYSPIWLPLILLYRYITRVYLRDTSHS